MEIATANNENANTMYLRYSTTQARTTESLSIPPLKPLTTWFLSSTAHTMTSMQSADRTPRQQIKALLMSAPMSSLQLAKTVGITEREVEDHLGHIMKSVARERSIRFILEPCECRQCGYAFRDRSKITRPSRCPRCRSEDITAPRFAIEQQGGKQK